LIELAKAYKPVMLAVITMSTVSDLAYKLKIAKRRKGAVILSQGEAQKLLWLLEAK
jgi:hypothetical protein